MTTQQSDDGAGRNELGRHLDRIWRELKQLTRQVESETRRGGQVAKLRYELRGLRQDRAELLVGLGTVVYDAQRAGKRRPALRNVDGYDEFVGALTELDERIGAKQAALDTLVRASTQTADTP